MLKRDDRSSSDKHPQPTLLRATTSVRPWRNLRGAALDKNVAAPKHDNPQLSEPPPADNAGEVAVNDVKVSPGWESTRMGILPILKRTLGLTSDAILLTIASPFFAAWWLSRIVRRLAQPRQ